MAWSDVVRKDSPAPSLPRLQPKALSSRDGITVAVVDANALITSSSNLVGLADQFFTVNEVLQEVRDPGSRIQLQALPFTVECLEPTEEALAKVVQFAGDTGDLQSLSAVDLKLLALSFTLEEQVYGSAHLRTRPPALQVTNVRGIREQSLPGWGSNVPNLEEWEEISEESHDTLEEESHILGLKNLNLDDSVFDTCLIEGENRLVDSHSDSSIGEGENCAGGHSGPEENDSDPSPPRTPIINELAPSGEGKLEVEEAVDGAKGDDEDIINGGDWERAISRSTRRKYDRRAARAALKDRSVSELEFRTFHQKAEISLEDDEKLEHCGHDQVITAETMAAHGGDDQEVENCEFSLANAEDRTTSVKLDNEVAFGDVLSGELQNYENGVNGGCISITESSVRGDEPISQDLATSENSWMLRPLSSSNVACITADFAMQNVLLQIGLRVMSPNGLQVQRLHRWVLKCEACRNITRDVGRIFCPKCGNGGTLYKVSVTIGPNGVVHLESRRRTSIRGTKYSLPMPKGGRTGVVLNPVLREDQLPHKLLYPRKKYVLHSDALTHSGIFTDNTRIKGQTRPPVREALAIFSGRRNPNDGRSRKRH